MNSLPISPAAGELVSALLDGQLRSDEWPEALAACDEDPACLDRWHDYHLIGDLLRSPASAAGDLPAVRDQDFLQRWQARLALEAAPAAALPVQLMQPMHPVKALTEAAIKGAAANDSRFSWRRAAAVVGLVATGSLAWQLWSGAGDAGPALAQSQSQPAVLVATPQGLMARDADLDALLAAHREWGGASALQIPSGFLRNATFDAPTSVGLSASGR